jgi:hypothetical protein
MNRRLPWGVRQMLIGVGIVMGALAFLLLCLWLYNLIAT